MAYEFIELNLIPTGDKPVFHAAQYDVGRPIIIKLKNGEDDFTPTGLDLELQVRKVDNNIVTAVPDSVDGNVVTFFSTQQMTACSGTNLCEVQLSDGSTTIATLHFFLVVQRDVLNGGISSASEIHDLTEQIAEIVPEVIGDDYYNKTEVDDLIAEHTFDPTNYYDKSETDALLDDKANVSDLPDMTNYYDKSETDALLDDKANVSDLPDMTNYYDKSETDALLDDKANVSDLPDMTNYYDKSEVDTKITDLYQIKSVSGSLIHISDGGDNIPMKSLESEIVAVESGSGTKSPTNPYTISGFDSGIITRCGKNLCPILSSQTINGVNLTSSADGTLTFNRVSTSLASSDFVIDLLLPNGTYTISANNSITVNSNNTFVRPYDSNGVSINILTFSSVNRTYTFTNSLSKITIRIDKDFAPVNFTLKIQLEKNNTATTYEAYNGNTYTFTFGQTVYGGHFDNKGNLVVTHGYIASYNGETINEPWVSSMDNYVPNTSPSTGAQVVYPLTTPNTLAVTSQNIPTLSGENNIFSNCGDTAIEYFTENSDGIAELIKAFM